MPREVRRKRWRASGRVPLARGRLPRPAGPGAQTGMRSRFSVILGLAVLTLAAGCAAPPQEAVDSAKAALEAARAQAAQEYAPDALKAAEDAVADLEAEIAAQSTKFAPLRSYKVAAEKAAAAQTAGEQAQTAATAGKEQARADAMGGLEGARVMLQETMTMLDSAPRGKGSAMDLAALKTDLEGAGAALAEAEGLIGAEQYRQAKAKVDAAQASIMGVRSQIEAAMQKAK